MQTDFIKGRDAYIVKRMPFGRWEKLQATILSSGRKFVTVSTGSDSSKTKFAQNSSRVPILRSHNGADYLVPVEEMADALIVRLIGANEEALL